MGQDGQVFLLVDLTCLFPGKTKHIWAIWFALHFPTPSHKFVKITGKINGPLPLLYPDNLTLFVEIQMERHANKEADEWAEGPPRPWGWHSVLVYCYVLAQWAGTIRDICDASWKKEDGCLPSGERVRRGNRHLWCQLSGLKEVDDAEKEFFWGREKAGSWERFSEWNE